MAVSDIGKRNGSIRMGKSEGLFMPISRKARMGFARMVCSGLEYHRLNRANQC